MVGPVPVGVNKFVLQANAPDHSLINDSDILGVTGNATFYNNVNITNTCTSSQFKISSMSYGCLCKNDTKN
jgi:hypothetical protein